MKSISFTLFPLPFCEPFGLVDAPFLFTLIFRTILSVFDSFLIEGGRPILQDGIGLSTTLHWFGVHSFVRLRGLDS